MPSYVVEGCPFVRKFYEKDKPHNASKRQVQDLHGVWAVSLRGLVRLEA